MLKELKTIKNLPNNKPMNWQNLKTMNGVQIEEYKDLNNNYTDEPSKHQVQGKVQDKVQVRK